MGANDVPFLFFLDPGFIGFLALCAIGYGVWWVIDRFRG